MANIWTAASNGDLARVTALLDQGISANAKDENTYTPLHAAASWGHEDVLRLLVQRGGSLQITDEDQETPLFVVESVEMAKIIVELGGDPKHTNSEGNTPAQHHLEDNPAISAYLASVTGEEIDLPSLEDQQDAEMDRTVDSTSNRLMEQVQEIMEESSRTGEDPEDKLRQLVTDTIGNVSEYGQAIGAESRERGGGNHQPASTRQRTDVDGPER